MKNHDFLVGGMQPLTMIDFPGRLATVIFAQGCNLRCRFCYNRTLLPDRAREMIAWKSVIEFLKDRQGFIEGVVFSGGEPCRQEGFIQALEQVRELGFETALHSNGFYAETVASALKLRLLNFIAVDFKTTFNRYSEVTGEEIDEMAFTGLLRNIAASGVKHEVRTTVHPDIAGDEEINEIAETIADCGIEKYVLQKFQFGEALDPKLGKTMSLGLKPATIHRLRQRFADFEVRGSEQSLTLPERLSA